MSWVSFVMKMRSSSFSRIKLIIYIREGDLLFRRNGNIWRGGIFGEGNIWKRGNIWERESVNDGYYYLGLF